jgi:L-alanine-DL-glutamate epimerase-like enolase superfamily enzyme
MSAIDTALWDIKGKALGLPVWQLLGGKINDNLRTYASQLQFGWSAAGISFLTEPGQYAEAAQQAVAEGFDCVKVDPVLMGMNGIRDVPMRGFYPRPLLRRFRERVEAVRNSVGPDVDIIVELHSLPSHGGAQQLIEVMQDLGIWLFEEPVHYAGPEVHLDLRRRVSARLAGGERFYTRWGALPYIQNRAIDVLQPDVGLVGGLTEGKKVCDLAHIYDITVQAHICGTPVAKAAGLHLEAAIPNFEIHEHHVYSLQSVNREICNEDLQPMSGRFSVPNGPGLGVTLNEAAFRDAERMSIR